MFIGVFTDMHNILFSEFAEQVNGHLPGLSLFSAISIILFLLENPTIWLLHFRQKHALSRQEKAQSTSGWCTLAANALQAHLAPYFITHPGEAQPIPPTVLGPALASLSLSFYSNPIPANYSAAHPPPSACSALRLGLFAPLLLVPAQVECVQPQCLRRALHKPGPTQTPATFVISKSQVSDMDMCRHGLVT